MHGDSHTPTHGFNVIIIPANRVAVEFFTKKKGEIKETTRNLIACGDLFGFAFGVTTEDAEGRSESLRDCAEFFCTKKL